MTTNIPEFEFPAPGPDLPSWPAFTDAPFKPGNNPSDQMRVYLQYLLDDRDNYPTDGFGPGTAPIQILDIIEPNVIGSNQGSVTASTDVIHSLQIYCLVCPPLENGEKRGGTDDLGWPFCGGDIQVVQSTSPAFDQIAGWTPQSGQVNQGLAVPKPSDGWENTSLACTLAIYMTTDVVDGTVPLHMNRPSVKSQLFIVSSTPRDGASDFGVLMPYRYSVRCTRGAQNGTDCNGGEPYSTSIYTPAPTSTQDIWDVLYPTSLYTAPARTSISSCVESRFNKCRTDGWYGWPIGQRVGIIIGVVVAVIILILLSRRISRSKWSHKREKARPLLLSELRSQQAAEEGAATGRIREEHASTSTGSGDAVGQSREDALPTYKEAMKTSRRTSGLDCPPTNGNTSTELPPVYAHAVQQSAPVARTRPRVPYPTLPASPPRR